MELGDFISSHFEFLVTLAFYYVPAIVGAAINAFVKHDDDPKTETKRSASRAGLLMFFSALVPSIILAAVNDYIEGLISLPSLRIGIAFIFGCVGDEALEIITSLKKMISIMKVLSKYIEKLKHITDISEDVVNQISKDKDETPKEDLPKPKDDKPKPPEPPTSDFDGYDDSLME